MASNGAWVFVLGKGAQADETALIHILDTSMYFPFVTFIGWLPSL